MEQSAILEMQTKLKEEIRDKSSQIFRDAYQMSIGELANLYKEEELEIHPEFQRVFRWSEFQKTKLIESIMLNIPIPSIFVSQNEEGIWDVIDGVQRLSTIFQFMGIFKDELDELVEALTLEKTDYLPSLANMTWEKLSKDQQIDFKRARIDVVIVKKESDPNTKYELFQRLNTGGTKLSGQEVRNCLMIMTSRKLYLDLKEMVEIEVFQNITPITDQKESEQYRMELLLRVLVPYMFESDIKMLKEYSDLADLLDKETTKLAFKYNEDPSLLDDFKDKFTNIVDKLSRDIGEDCFKKYQDDKFKGPFLVGAYQAIMSGALFNYEHFMIMDKNRLEELVQGLYSIPGYEENRKPGTRVVPKLVDLTIIGKEHFKNVQG
jgi:hypothetical protein A60131_14695